MGTTAVADAKSALSLSIAHNMDSTDQLTTQILAGYLGMPKALTNAYADASGSKAVSYDQTTNTITYYYIRGDVKLKGEINLTTQENTWSTTLTDAKRFNALAQGLKVAGAGSTATSPVNQQAAVGTLGVDTGITFPT